MLGIKWQYFKTLLIYFKIIINSGLRWWLSGRESAHQCRRHVQSLIQEDPTCAEQLTLSTPQLSLCPRAVGHSYRAHLPRRPELMPVPHERSNRREARTPHSPQPEQSPPSNEDSAQQKIKKKTKIINSFYVNLYSILSKMKKLVRRLTLLQNFEYLFNVQLYRKLVDLHICFYIVS